MTHSDCFEKGHTPSGPGWNQYCSKCDELLYPVTIGEATVWHTQAELDRLWHGVDREAARAMGECECGHDPMIPSGAHHSGCPLEERR